MAPQKRWAVAIGQGCQGHVGYPCARTVTLMAALLPCCWEHPQAPLQWACMQRNTIILYVQACRHVCCAAGQEA